jgi:ATP-dependent Clp protease protease subunit
MYINKPARPMVMDPTNIAVPYILDNTGNDERVWDLWSRLSKDRVIFLGDDIDDHVANIIVAQLLFLESVDREEDIYLYIGSGGGSVSAGLAILDMMNYIKPNVHTICYGMAASMAAVLLACGTKGKRFAMPNSSIMIHQVSGGAQGQATDILITAKRVAFLKERLTRILADSTGHPYEKVLEDAERDYWMTAQEAKEYGIIDEILPSRKNT